MYGWRGRIGLIVASSDQTVEMDFHAMKPDGVGVYVARVPLLETNTPEEKLKALERMDAAIPDAARLLSPERLLPWSYNRRGRRHQELPV